MHSKSELRRQAVGNPEALVKRIAELEAALRPLVAAARKRQAHWSSQSGAVSDGEEASWLGKAEWWKRLADAGDAALTKST